MTTIQQDVAIERIRNLAISAANCDVDLAIAPPQGRVFGADLPPRRIFTEKSLEAWRLFDEALEEVIRKL